MARFFIFLKRKKLISVIFLLVVIILLCFFFFIFRKKEKNLNYSTLPVKRGNISVIVSGSGQVINLESLEIKPKISGEVAKINIKNEQIVKTGDLIVQLDTQDALRTLREVETDLEIGRLELDDLLAPVDDYTLLQYKNSLVGMEDDLTKLKLSQEFEQKRVLEEQENIEESLTTAYEDAFTYISNAFLDLPTTITVLDNILHGYEIYESEITVSQNPNDTVLKNSFLSSDSKTRDDFINLIDKAEENYQTIRKKYDDNFNDYQKMDRYVEKEIIENILEKTIETSRGISDTIKSQNNMLDYWVDYRSNKNLKIYDQIIQYQSDLNSYMSKVNSHLSSLLSVRSTIKTKKEDKLNTERDILEIEQNHPLDLAAAKRKIQEQEEKINDLISGATEIETKNKKLSIQQKENKLLEAQQNLNDHFIKAPFDGLITNLDAKKGDDISSSTVLASLISKQQIAEITLNEIEAAKIKIGQQVDLNFDALDGLLVRGEVMEVDSLGTVTQGVVSYNVRISFKSDDERIKPGMSINASIIIDSKENVLLIPASVLKSQGDFNFIEILVDNKPQRKKVVVGLNNDIMVEIIEGLNENDLVISSLLNDLGDLNNQNIINYPSGSMQGVMRIMH